MSNKFTLSGLSNNLISLMEHKNVGIGELARKTEISPSTIAKIQANPDINPTIHSLIALSNYFGVNVSQLIGEIPIDYSFLEGKKEQLVRYTYLPKVTLDHLVNGNLSILESVAKTIPTELLVSKTSFALEIEKHSIQEIINFDCDNILAIVDPEAPLKNGDSVVSCKGSALPTIDQYSVYGADKYLKPLMPDLKTYPISEKHKIIGVIREYRLQIRV